MTLVFMDGFDHYETTAQLAQKWGSGVPDGSVAVSTAYGRLGSAGVACGAQDTFWKTLDPVSSFIIGFALHNHWAGDRVLFAFSDSITSTIHVELRLDAGGHLYFTRNGTAIGVAGTVPLAVNTWYFVEAKVVISPTVGMAMARVNGVLDINGTSLNTQTGASTTVNIMRVGNTGAGDRGMFLDDFYICDTNGAQNNDFLGDCRVECLLPSGVGAESQWTPLSGANYTNVDENPPDGDTTYNASNTVNEVDTYAMTDLVSAAGLVYGVQFLEYVRKDDAGSRAVAPVVRIGGTDHPGSSVSLSSGYGYTREVMELSPATAVAWTIPEVNAMECGIKVTG